MTDLTTTKNEKYSLESLRANRSEFVIILSDTSGSMDSYMEGGVTQAQALVEAIRVLLQTSDARRTEYMLINFHSDVYMVCNRTNKYTKLLMMLQPKAEGGTDMALGLLTALTNKPNRIILLSDGQPTSTAGALEAAITNAVEQSVRVDTIGIGAAPMELMRGISERTGGKHTQARSVQELKEAYRQLETKTYYLTDQRS